MVGGWVKNIPHGKMMVACKYKIFFVSVERPCTALVPADS